MKPLMIAFDVTPRHRGPRWVGATGARRGRVGVAALVMALSWLGLSAWQAWTAHSEREQARLALASATRAGNAGPRHADARRPTPRPGELAAWAELANRLNLPWSALLTALERATPGDVALVAVEPEAQRATIRVVAEAPSLDPLLAYAGQLRAAPLVHAVTLSRHETVSRPSGPAVRLQIQLQMRLGTETIP